MGKQSKKIFIRSFGRQMNDADSEVIERILEMGLRKDRSYLKQITEFLRRIIEYCVSRIQALVFFILSEIEESRLS